MDVSQHETYVGVRASCFLKTNAGSVPILQVRTPYDEPTEVLQHSYVGDMHATG